MNRLEMTFGFIERNKIFLSGAACSVIGLYIMCKCCGHGVCQSDARLDGKTVLITGANTGLGKDTAKEIARRGARVLVACRSVEKAESAVEEIKKDTGNTNVTTYKLDLASLQSVRECAAEIIKHEERLDILINNAAVSVPPAGSKTADGFELQFGVNHLGHFLFTNLLLDMLKKSAPSRIVNVAAKAHEFVQMDFEDLNNERNVPGWKGYSRSKLANVLFTLELSKQLKGTGVTANSLHPGIIRTDLTRHVEKKLGLCWSFLVCCLWPIQKLFMKDVNLGIQTTVYCAVAEELEGVSGKYYSDCVEKATAPQGRDKEAASRLWKISEEMVGLATTK